MTSLGPKLREQTNLVWQGRVTKQFPSSLVGCVCLSLSGFALTRRWAALSGWPEEGFIKGPAPQLPPNPDYSREITSQHSHNVKNTQLASNVPVFHLIGQNYSRYYTTCSRIPISSAAASVDGLFWNGSRNQVITRRLLCHFLRFGKPAQQQPVCFWRCALCD